jgi:hypothetical protein
MMENHMSQVAPNAKEKQKVEMLRMFIDNDVHTMLSNPKYVLAFWSQTATIWKELESLDIKPNQVAHATTQLRELRMEGNDLHAYFREYAKLCSFAKIDHDDEHHLLFG